MTLFLFYITLIGLLVGSFLNVVIFRLPRMLYAQESLDLASGKDFKESNSSNTLVLPTRLNPPPMNIIWPRSQCPACHHHIAWFDNIPVISFLILKAHCRHCQRSISKRYPLVEGLTALLSFLVALRFGPTFAMCSALLITWALIALSFIDFEETLLPDSITLPFLWLGLLFSVFEIHTTPSSAILGAILGYGSLWTVYWGYKLLTQKEGMGYGDFKLLAMLGACLGWEALPLIILIASFLGAMLGIGLILFKGRDKNIPIPFGPFLAIGGFTALLYGSKLSDFYLRVLFL